MKKTLFLRNIKTECHVRERNQRLPLDFVGGTNGRDAGVYHAGSGGGNKAKQSNEEALERFFDEISLIAP